MSDDPQQNMGLTHQIPLQHCWFPSAHTLDSCVRVLALRLKPKGMHSGTYNAAEGNAFWALRGSISGAGAPPKSRDSKGHLPFDLSTKSDTIDGTLRATVRTRQVSIRVSTHPPATATLCVSIKLKQGSIASFSERESLPRRTWQLNKKF